MIHNYPALTKLDSVVAIGGGHGLGRVMSSLSFLAQRLTGIVTTTDNGSSTGRIRAQQGGIAWGDIRNCLNQIHSAPTTAAALFEYRFAGSGDLAGHSLGNLIFRALEDMQIRPLEGINLVRNFLRVKANLIPMSEIPVHLGAQLHNGSTVVGEVNIDKLTSVPKRLFLLPDVPTTAEAITAINHAQLILLGPGSFFTSIIPPLLLPEITQAIKNSNAKIVFIDNLGLEHSSAATLSLAERIYWIERETHFKIDGIITHPNGETKQLTDKVIIAQDFYDKEVTYRHDRTLLCQYLDQITQILLPDNLR